ncbi:hypothetical protein QQP08_010668, partial [Theobroma cacao]
FLVRVSRLIKRSSSFRTLVLLEILLIVIFTIEVNVLLPVFNSEDAYIEVFFCFFYFFSVLFLKPSYAFRKTLYQFCLFSLQEVVGKLLDYLEQCNLRPLFINTWICVFSGQLIPFERLKRWTPLPGDGELCVVDQAGATETIQK